MSKLFHHNNDAVAKAIVIPRLFSENSQAKNTEYIKTSSCSNYSAYNYQENLLEIHLIELPYKDA